MQKIFVQKAALCAAVLLSLAGLSSCVNEQYEISEDKLDLNMTVFQEGLCLPIGTTEKLSLGNILKLVDPEGELNKYLITENGAYSVFYKPEEPIDMSEQLKSLNGVLDIDAISFDKKVDFSLQNVDLGSVSYEGAEYPMEQSLSDMFSGIDVKIDPITEEFSIDANIRQYSESIGDIDFQIDLGDHAGEFKYAGVPGDLVIPPALLTDAVKDVEMTIGQINTALGREIRLETSIEDASVSSHIEFPFHEYVKSVSDIHIREGAKLKVTVKMLNTCFTSGSIIPHVDMDLHELFHLSSEDGTPLLEDHIVGDFVLNNENGWSASGEYLIKELVIDNSKDWKHATNAEGKDVLWLDKTVNASISGSLNGGDLKTTPAALAEWLEAHPTAESRNVMVSVQLSFEDLVIDDVTAELNPIPFASNDETFDIVIPELKFPEEVKGVKEVVFSEQSAIDVQLSVANLSSIGDLSLNLNDLVVTFPDRLVIEGADETNTIVIPGADLAAGTYRQKIKVLGVKIGDVDENGVVPAYKGLVTIKTGGYVSGELHTNHLPQTKENDLALNGYVETNLEIEDYTLILNGYTIDSQTNPDLFRKESIELEIPKEIADIKGLTIYPKGNPEIRLNIDMPEISMTIAPVGPDGLKVYLPKMLVLKKGGYAYEKWFDTALNAIVLPSGIAFPSEIVLPVDHIAVEAKKNETDGKYYCSGSFEITGAVGIPEGALMTKADVDLLSRPDAKVSFVAVIPALEPDNISMTSYSASIDRQNIEFELLKDVDIPQMLKEVGDIELDNVYLTLAVQTGEGFPSLGEDADLSMALKLSLPDFIVIDDERYADGVLSLNGLLEAVPGKSAMKLEMEPIKVASLDLDMDYEQLKELSGELSVEGSVTLAGVSLVVDEWVGKTHSIDVKASLATMNDGLATDKLKIGKVTGKVDYQLDPVNTTLDLTMLGDFLEEEGIDATLELPTFYVTADLQTNLGVPVKADIKLTPYYGPEAGEVIRRQLVIDGAPSSSEPLTTRIYISNEAPDAQQSYDQFLDLDIFSLLYKDEAKTELIDSLKVELTAGTDAQKSCIFEPSAEYTLKVDYSAGVPFALGDDFDLSYAYTIEMPQEAATIMSYGSLALCGEVESSFPIGISLTARLLDSNKEELKVTDKPIGIEIKSGDASGNPTKSKIELLFGNENKIDISDLKSVELVFEADASAARGAQFREDNFVKATLYALIPEGITLDAAKMIEDGKTEGNTDKE